MFTTTVFLVMLAASGVSADVVTLNGERFTGEIESLNAKQLVVNAEGGPRTIPVSELQEIRLNSEGNGTGATERSEMGITLKDGSLLAPRTLSASQRDVTLDCPLLGELKIPKTAVLHVRLSRGDGRTLEQWQSLVEREHQNDLVVVRKGDALDHVDGVVGAINAESVSVLLEGSVIPVPRGRVFGVIYATGKGGPPKAACRCELSDGQQIAAAEAVSSESGFTVRTLAAGKLDFSADQLRLIDFSLGKIRSLASLEPTFVKYPEDHPLYLPDVWKFRVGQNSRGEPLLLDGRPHEDGLWMHSGTTLRYRLGREYRRLRGRMGIDEDLGDCAPKFSVIFRGDGRVLLEAQFSRLEPPQDLDLDVSGVRELEIEVVSTDPDGICEHFDLVEARLIK